MFQKFGGTVMSQYHVQMVICNKIYIYPILFVVVDRFEIHKECMEMAWKLFLNRRKAWSPWNDRVHASRQLTQGQIQPSDARSFAATQQTQYIHPMLLECWTSVCDAGPTFKQHWISVSCWLEWAQRWANLWSTGPGLCQLYATASYGLLAILI